MATYVYITKQCLLECSRLNKKQQVEAFAERIRKSQRTDYFERFHPPILKKPIDNLRLLAEERPVCNDLVIVFRRLVTRGGHDYVALKASDYRVIPGTNDEAEIEEEALASYIASIQDTPPPPPPAPDNLELDYLHSVLGSSPDVYRDYHCCETSFWVESMMREEFANRAMDFNKCVFETIDESGNAISELRCKDDSRFGILFRCFPDWKMVVLLAPFKGDAPHEEVRKRYPQICEQSVQTKETVIRIARRAYPHALLLTPDAWIQVQKKKEGNMALSEEEIEVLESARLAEGGYPLFINGRAGSGKSTILQYLFAEYLYHAALKTADDDIRLPVFFACNDELLARCSAGVTAVATGTFNQNEDSARMDPGLFEERLARLSAQSFQNFHKWLRGLTQPGEYPESLRFDYGRFKVWWERTFSRTPSARKLYGPEISWHIIRTYVKGWHLEGYLDAEDYEERAFSTRQNSVTIETYRVVFETVWKRYHEDQKLMEFWDDQDLARHTLENDLIPANHPVVFCDEAQDFTRIELEILHRHSLFSARTLAPYDQPKIPFAFAGDPFQTLNPTGFQWDATRAFFTEKFIKTYPGQPKREINYQELTFNYRSNAPVVQFCNSLQLARKVLFKLHEIRPQLPWAEENNSPSVVYFDRTDPDTLRSLKAQSDIRVIIPCEEGGETDWTRQNGLADYVDFDETGVPKNVASASRVKGLEFPRVVLFGFGDACPASLKQALINLERLPEGDGLIELQYYLNRLYVAASRPMKRLFVIDSDEAIQNFWRKIFSSQEDMMTLVRDTAAWEGKCGQILHGNAASWEGDREDPRETAETLQKDAGLRKDPYLYRQAAQYFASAKALQLASECKCEALELEGKFLEAAENWRSLGVSSRSLMAAWKAGREADEFIVRLANERPELKVKMHVRFASHFQVDRGLDGWAVLLKEFVEALADRCLRDEVVTESAWKSAVEHCLDRVLKGNEKAEALWDVCYSRAFQLDQMGLRLSQRVLGSLAYRAGRMVDAYPHWLKLPMEQRQGIETDFLRAKVATVPYPENLEVYGDLLRRDESKSLANEIIELASGNPATLDTSQREVLLRAALTLSDWAKALDHLRFVKSEDLVIHFMAKLATLQSSSQVDQMLCGVLRRWFELLAEQGRWRDMHLIASQRKIPNRSVEAASKYSAVSRWLAANNRQIGYVTAEFLAVSDLFADARNDDKGLFAQFLRDHFTIDFAWVKEVHPLRVGQAFEKAGLFKETLPYYASVFGFASASDEVVRLARTRWVKTKLDQAKREAESSPRRAEKIEEEVNAFGRKHGIVASDLERPFPGELPAWEKVLQGVEPEKSPAPITPTEHRETSPPANSKGAFARKVTLGSVEIRVGSNGQRVNFLNQETDQQAFVLIGAREARLDGEAILPDESGYFDFATWGIKFHIDSSKAKLCVETSDGAEISLPVNLSGNTA
jgi:hypothetical protein